MAPVKRLGWSFLAHEIKSSGGFLGASTSHASAPAVSPPAAVARPDARPSAAAARITPAVLFITVVLAVVLLASGLLHVLRRLFIKTHRNNARAEAVERQLQQLFHLHEAGAGPGLDQAAIDALPAFAYAELSATKGAKRQFDCAVCLTEFAADDRLRLLPPCGHAFHVGCIDTWLASSATCPLCRTVLSSRALAGAAGDASAAEPDIEEQKLEDAPKEPVTLPVRLGRFKNVQGSATADGETGTSSHLDGRRCFSMASSYQYVLADDSLVVSVRWRPGDGSAAMRPGAAAASGDEQGKKVCAVSRGDSFSVSKIWQWRRSGGRRLPGLRAGSASPTENAPPWASPPRTRQETDS
ncbi:RING-H2 finger protein ATL46-like [Lolium rigidum]|uniref:RING-H2 finger protein ATL46-like n=1 Tax=Lolium rigidum TaxID=89674 RepID=UPI001F5C0F42|nr:RING-H2 finger protein ATL46-like [Lolium rigidum]